MTSLGAMTSPRVKFGAALALTLLTCSQGLLMEASKVAGQYEYHVGSVPFLAELTKLCVSSALLYREFKLGRKPRMTTDLGSVALFPIPSLIYVVHNNVQFHIMKYVDAATYQILGNLKIVTTGVLFRLVLGRQLTRSQWLALLLLTAGACTSQIDSNAGCHASGEAQVSFYGYILGCLSACLSALAGVYTEFLLKKNNDSLYWQNLQLYGFGAILNALRLCYEFGITNWMGELTTNYNLATWIVVGNFAFAGLFVSWIQKYADTIVKVYSTSSAMLITATLSVWFFHLQPTFQLFIGISICCISIVQYFIR